MDKSVRDNLKVNDIRAVSCSEGVNDSRAVIHSEAVNCSRGIYLSGAVSTSNRVNNSGAVSWSDGVSCSEAVSCSEGVNAGEGVNDSFGINSSNGVNASFGIINCFGVNNALFLADKEALHSIFGAEVSRERFYEVKGKLESLLDGWFPRFNNAFELLEKAGGDWLEVKASDINKTLEDCDKPYEAWKDMPQEAIEYVRSLPEFNEKMFIRITGIDDNNKKNSEVANRKRELIEKANKLLAEAELL